MMGNLLGRSSCQASAGRYLQLLQLTSSFILGFMAESLTQNLVSCLDVRRYKYMHMKRLGVHVSYIAIKTSHEPVQASTSACGTSLPDCANITGVINSMGSILMFDNHGISLVWLRTLTGIYFQTGDAPARAQA